MTNGQTVMYYRGHRLTASVMRPARQFVKKTKPCQFSLVTSLCVRALTKQQTNGRKNNPSNGR